MAIKLYPPQITGSLPAFYKTYNVTTGEATGVSIKIPYAMNQGVGYTQIDGFCARIKNVSSGTYICPPQYSVNFNTDKNEVIFNIAKEYADIFEEGQYYKVQLAYYQLMNTSVDIGGNTVVVDKDDPNAQKNIGYFSSVGIIKCVAYPSVRIEGYSLDSTNLFTGSFLGVYDLTNAIDKTEKVYSYKFSIYTNANDLYYTTGDLIHNSTNDVEYGISTDTLIINDFISNSNEVFQVEYAVTTLNGLTVSSPRYRMTSEQLLAPNKKLEVKVKPNQDEAYMEISFLGEYVSNIYGVKEEDVYYGEYILTRASEEDNYTEWVEMHRFRLQDEKPSSISFKDFSIKQGVKYKYGVSQFNIWNIVSSRMVSKEVSIDFEDMFLFDGERQLKIRFNPKMTKFGTNVLEQKVETIGSKFPYIFRNGKVEYKEFPIQGLISCLMDNARLFYMTDYDYIINRKTTETKGVDNELGFFNHFDLSEENILRERQFKLDVLDWLNNGKPKMFKSATEGNYIVRLFKVSLKPEDKLGRMLHTFSCTAYEIADFTYENLYKLGFVQKSNISRYVSLWKSYNFKDWAAGQDIVINFDDISDFLIQDLMPGTKIQLFQKGASTPIEIMIGATGSYKFTDTSQTISKIIIPVAEGQKLSGTLECQYSGLRYSDFDAIKNIKLKTTVSQQFVGVAPELASLNHTAADGVSDTVLGSLNARILYNKYKTIYDKDGKEILSKGKQISDALKIGTQHTLKDRFLPGDIMHQIESDIYNFQKPKVKVLNVEQAHFRLRDLIPIYKVPYKYLPEESKEKVQLDGKDPIFVSEKDRQQNIIAYDKYQGSLKFNTYFWSVTPFGQPYPIDAMTKIICGDAVMNDPFCIFELFEYQDGEWVHFSGHNDVSDGIGLSDSYGGWYYDAYYGEQYPVENRGLALTNIYDPTFFLQDRMIYAPIDEENNKIINILLTYDDIYIKDNDEKYVKYDKNQLEHNADVYYYNDLKTTNTGVVEDNYIAIAGSIVNQYLNNKEYYDSSLWVEENNAYVQLKNAVKTDINTVLCIEQLNKIDLTYAREMHFDNLGEIDIINIGNGIMLELTYQAQIIDYYTEENNAETAAAKKAYEDSAAFLANVFEDYENIANADADWRKYEALYNIYYKMMNGIDASGLMNLKAINYLIILALMNIELIPLNILVSIYSKCSFEVKTQLEQLMASNDTYSFETVLNIICEDIGDNNQKEIIKAIILKLYKDKQTYNQLQFFNDTERLEVYNALASDELENMANKIQKMESIVNEINASYNSLRAEENQKNNEFVQFKQRIKTIIDEYNDAIRFWLMGLYLIESQLYIPEGKTKPCSLEDIRIFFSNQNAAIEDNIANSKENLQISITKAKDIVSQIETAVNTIYTYEKIKQDKAEDINLDIFITEKEYSDIKTTIVLVSFLNVIYEQWKEQDTDKELADILAQGQALVKSLMAYELFNDFDSVVQKVFTNTKKVCDNLFQKILVYYSEYKDDLSKVPYDEIVPESKELIEQYILEVDNLIYIVNYQNLNDDILQSYKKHQEIFISNFFTVSEMTEFNNDRLIISDNTQGTTDIKSQFVQDDEIYFSFGLSTEEDAKEKSLRIKKLLNIISNINEKLKEENKDRPIKIIECINEILSSTKAMKNIIMLGHCKDGVNPSIKSFNSFMSDKRLELESALSTLCDTSSSDLQKFYNANAWLQKFYPDFNQLSKVCSDGGAAAFFTTVLFDKEFKPEIESINENRKLRKETEIIIPQDIGDFGKNIEYVKLLEDEFKNEGGIFENISSNNLANITKIDNIVLDTSAVSKIEKEGYSHLTIDLTNKESDVSLQENDVKAILYQFKVLFSYSLDHKFFETYTLDEFIPMFMGNIFNNELKSGLFYWYTRFNIGQSLEYYLQLLQQASTILAEYSVKKDNYMTKCNNYYDKYKNAHDIYASYKNTKSWDYYSDTAQDKQQAIKNAIDNVQNTWDTFILTLDKAFTEEIERGMYI